MAKSKFDFIELLRSRFEQAVDPRYLNKAIFISLLTIFSALFLYIFGIFSFIQMKYFIGFIYCAVSTVFLFNMMLLYLSRNLLLSQIISILLFSFIFIAVVWLEKRLDPDVLVWFLLFPIIAIFSSGRLRGFFYSLSFLLLSTALIYYMAFINSFLLYDIYYYVSILLVYILFSVIMLLIEIVMKGQQENFYQELFSLRTLIFSMSDTIYFLNSEGRLVKFFKPDIDGVMRNQSKAFLGRPFNYVLPDAISRELDNGQGRIKNLTKPIEFDFSTGDDKRSSWFRAKISQIHQDKQGLRGYAIIVRDITERRRMEDSERQILYKMGERVKELNCIYQITKALHKQASLTSFIKDLLSIIPEGWEYPFITKVKITLDGQEFCLEKFDETEWVQHSDIIINGKKHGEIKVFYVENRSEDQIFQIEQERLLESITTLLSREITIYHLKTKLKKSLEG